MLSVPPTDISSLHIDLTDRIVAVTGAGSGIGAAIATLFVTFGARVALLDRDEEHTQALAGRLGPAAAAIVCDVVSTDSVRAAADRAEGELGPVDTLINSAGIVALAPAEDLSDEAWGSTLAVNLTGTYRCCRIFGSRMLERGFGRIVNLSSQAAHVGLAEHVAYCASKAGVEGMTRVLALEWGGRGLTVNTISPTVVLTPLGQQAWDNPKGEAHRAEIPVGRFAMPDEIAATAAFLVSRAADMINGADLRVDGGFTIR